jgi:uncharacterized glyoxalase superfamily protein PhnB
MASPHTNPPEGWPQISSALLYDDPAAALEWLEKAFGFRTRLRVEDGEGGIIHTELELGSGLVMLASPSHMGYGRSPKSLDGANTQSLYVFVDDVDAHCERARAAGASIMTEPTTQHYGDRLYSCRDCEGHVWTFGQRVADPAPPPGDEKVIEG